MLRNIDHRFKIFHVWLFISTAFFALQSCEKFLDLKQPKKDPSSIFDDTWNALDTRYVFFSLKNVNWDSVYNFYHSQIKSDMNDNELFSVINNMLQTLKDGHVSLISDFNTATYEGFYQLYPANFNYSNVINNYLKNDYKTTGPLIYKTDADIGYIYYKSFENDISDASIDSVLSGINDTKGLIIDVRNNNGGNSENVKKFFERFINQRQLVKYEVEKKGKAHDDFSDPVAYYISPKGLYYNKPICVLTNRSCFSACNDFVLYMSQLSNVTLIGDKTGGGGGIPSDYILANGWKLQYTSTATLSPNKIFVENGIDPDINVSITPIEEMNGDDPILDKAIQLLQ